METTGEHTGGSSHTEHGSSAGGMNLNWAPVPTDWTASEQTLIGQLGLEKFMEICKDKDEAVAWEAINNYNATTRKTTVQGTLLELNAETVSHAFDFPLEPGRKEPKLSDVAISKYLDESEEELRERKRMKQGITCSKIKEGRVYRFITETIAMKGTSTYISEGLFGKFLGKATKGYHVDLAKEVTETTATQMEKVKTKAQKLIKCGHVWVGLYRQATGMPDISQARLPDMSSPSKPSKATPKSISDSKALSVEKRKAEQTPGEQASKKSRSGSTSVSTKTRQGVDTLQTIMERKRRERDLKLQQQGQQLSKQGAKEEEVSQVQTERADLRVTPAKPPKPMGTVMHAKSFDALQELHQKQLDKLKKQRMAPVPIVLEPQFTHNITYGNIPVLVPQSVGLHADLNLESRMRSILTAVNTITTATAALVEESQGASTDDLHELQEQLGQEQLLTEQLQTQNEDIKKQLEREQELVQHSKDEVARLRAKCQELTQANKEALHEIKQLKGAKRGYKALHIELGKELDRRFVYESVAHIIRPADSDGTVSFTLEELEELTTTMITKIHEASEDHDFPMFKALVTEYMQAWKESQTAAPDSDDEEEEDKEDKDEEKDEDSKNDDDDDDDGDNDQGTAGKDQAKGEEDDDEENRDQREDPHDEDAGF